MSKIIEETFSSKIGDTNVHITARSYNDHWLKMNWSRESGQFPFKAKDLKELATFILACVQQIEQDPDFNHK